MEWKKIHTEGKEKGESNKVGKNICSAVKDVKKAAK